MVVKWVNMYIPVVLSVLVLVDMVLKMLESGVMAMEVVVVVRGGIVLEGVPGICCLGTVMVLEKLNYAGIWCCGIVVVLK